MNQVSLVEQLKEVVKAQNGSLRQKHNEIKTLRAENSRLSGLVQELEIENEGLKGLLVRYQTDSSIGAENGQSNNGTPRPSTLTISSPNTAESELFKTALTSPDSASKSVNDKSHITLALSSTPNSACVSPKKGTLVRTESSKNNRKSFYELSPDISDRHVQMLEKNYGGKERANRAARIIQQHYRSWAMKKTYVRLRTQSEARRTSMKGHLSKQNSLRSPSSSGSMSPTGQPIPLNINLSLSESENSKELSLKTPESENQPRRNSAIEEFKPIQADIDIDSNFLQVKEVDTRQSDMSVRRVSEDISSIEISKNLLNNSIGQKMIIDEVFQHILSPRKDSISLSSRSDSFRSRKSDDLCNVEEDSQVSETDPQVEGAPINTEADEFDGLLGTNCVKKEQTDRTEGAKVDIVEVEISRETEEAVMAADEGPGQNDMTNSTDHLPVKEEPGQLRGNCDSFDIGDNHSYSWPTLDQLSHGDDTTSLSGSSLSPSSSIMQTFYEDKEKDVRIGINHFNRKPKKGINYLIDTGILDDFDAEGICKFLREEPGMNKQKIGEYLGDLRNPLSMRVLRLFVRTIPMEGKEIDEALRLFQSFFRMPGEAQKIERLVEEFSTAYVDANPETFCNNSDTILVLAFAIIMLNTDLHSPNVKRKMSKDEFTRNLRGTNDGEDLPGELLSAIYDRVEKRPFKTGPDNLDAIYKYEKQILGKVPWTTLALPHRQLRQVTTLYEIQHGGKKKEKPHHRVVFLFNDMMVVTKERGQAGQKGIHFYSYKNSYQLCDITFQLFNNNYYKYGVRVLSRIDREVLIVFHAKKEDIRKAFYSELRDCIEETCVMENERIADEKTRQVMGYRQDLEDTVSLTLPRFDSQRKKKLAPDSLSLVNEPGTLPQGRLIKNSPMSSSLQNISQADGGFYNDSFQKSTSMASFDFSGSDTTSGVVSDLSSSNGSVQNLPKRLGMFSSKRVKNQMERKLTKSAGSLEDIKSMRRKTSSTSDQRKSEFFVTSPIAT